MDSQHKFFSKRSSLTLRRTRTMRIDISNVNGTAKQRVNELMNRISPPLTGDLHKERSPPCMNAENSPVTPTGLLSTSSEFSPSEKDFSHLEVPSQDHSYCEHLHETYNELGKCEQLPWIGLHQLVRKQIILKKPQGYERNKTVVFDLDETLVHGFNLSEGCPDTAITFTSLEGLTETLGLSLRPFAKECLKAAAREFEVIVFTASHQVYADQVLDYIDPKHKYIHHRVYREHCLQVNNLHVKDLRIFSGRKLENIVLVDNSCTSFGEHLDNGIPIISWKGDREDRELLYLIPYLARVARTGDVRDLNRSMFKLMSFRRDYEEAERIERRVNERSTRIDLRLNKVI